MKRQLYIGNICKVTKVKINYEPERQIKDCGVSSLICEETGIYMPASFNVGNMQYEIYKKNAILIKISDDLDLISEYAEVLNIENRKLIVDKKRVFYSVTLYLNQLFVPEASLVLENQEKQLVKTLNKKL